MSCLFQSTFQISTLILTNVGMQIVHRAYLHICNMISFYRMLKSDHRITSGQICDSCLVQICQPMKLLNCRPYHRLWNKVSLPPQFDEIFCQNKNLVKWRTNIWIYFNILYKFIFALFSFDRHNRYMGEKSRRSTFWGWPFMWNWNR